MEENFLILLILNQASHVNNLLSVTVVCEKAANADALATSFMVMGKEEAINFIESKFFDSIFCFMVYDSKIL